MAAKPNGEDRGIRPGHSPTAPPSKKQGSLVVVGSGIQAIGQFTLQAAVHLREADSVYFSVADPVTAAWVLEQRPSAVDLNQFYADGKKRWQTYVQMAEVMLADVRIGRHVLGIFYGHPGVFVNASHRAIAIARLEGFDAVMLPGISAQDCLFADLGVDPGRPGCQTLEATDLLLYERPVLVDMHVVIFAVGYVGGFTAIDKRGASDRKLDVLLDYLGRFYDSDSPLINYVAARYPMNRPILDRVTLAELREPDVASRVTALSTFYFPPRLKAGSDVMASRLGVKLLPPRDWMLGALRGGIAYGPEERRAVEAMANHAPPATYASPRPPTSTYQLVRELVSSPTRLRVYLDNPDAFCSKRPRRENAGQCSSGMA